MTDEELVKRLRMVTGFIRFETGDRVAASICLSEEAADRIEQLVATNEALVKERDQWVEHTKNAVWSDSEELKLANDRIKGLEAVLMAIRKRAMSTRGGQAYRELPVFVIRASSTALKGD